jgi:GNAT superfamily N-acetyltransferase
MELRWLDPHHLDTSDVAGALAVLEAARAADSPVMIPTLATSYTYRLRYGFDGCPPLTAVHRDPQGRVVGVVDVWLSTWDNPHVAIVNVTVDPLVRRAGLGRALFGAGVERARAEGRTTIISQTFNYPTGLAFLAAMGMRRVAEEVLRRQDPAAVDRAVLDKLFADAEAHATAYELVRLAGRTPDDLIDAVTVMTGAINDAPLEDLDIEDEVFTPERVRAFESSQIARGRRIYRLMARHRGTGELAGHTVVGVDVERPWLATQFDTSVVRAHRGHRLGLLLKIGMMRWMAEAEAQIRVLDTDNMASNEYMIRINDLIGYEVIGSMVEFQRTLA